MLISQTSAQDLDRPKAQPRATYEDSILVEGPGSSLYNSDPLKTFKIIFLDTVLALDMKILQNYEETNEISIIPSEYLYECSDYYENNENDTVGVLVSVSHFFNKTIFYQPCKNHSPNIAGIIFISQIQKYQIKQTQSMLIKLKKFFFKEKMKIVVVDTNGKKDNKLFSRKEERKLSTYFNYFIDVAQYDFGGDIPYTVLIFDQYDFFDSYDYESVYWELYYYYQNYLKYDYCGFHDICDIEDMTLALIHLLTRPNNPVKGLICEHNISPYNYNFCFYTSYWCSSNLNYYFQLLMNYASYCLKYESEFYQGTSDSFSYYSYNIGQSLSYSFARLKITAYSGTTVSGTLDSSLLSNNEQIKLTYQIYLRLDAPDFNFAQCNFYPDSVLIDTKLFFINFSAYSDILIRKICESGYLSLPYYYYYSNCYYEYCPSYAFNQYITLQLYQNAPYGVRFSDYSGSRDMTYTINSVTVLFSVDFIEFRLICNDTYCYNCDLNVNSCLNCISGFYLSGELCLSCPPGCAYCYLYTYCSYCSTFYGIIPGTSVCGPCPNCYCDYTDYCYSCLSNAYYRDYNTNMCLPCTDTNCISCYSNQNICYECSSEFLLVNNTCVSNCISNCLSCLSNPLDCDECIQGYFYNSGTCSPCYSDCLTCNSSTICLTCKSFNSEPDMTGCKCSSGYGIDFSLISPNFCSKCKDDCLTCSTFDTCLSCISNFATVISGECMCDTGYYNITSLIDELSCKICGEACSSCINGQTCLTCIANNTDITNGECICKVGYYNTTSLIDAISCKKCDDTCTACSDGSICTSCEANNTDLINGKCICKTGYYNTTELIDVLSCKICGDTCSACSDGLSCSSCKAGNTDLINGQCICKDGFYNTTRLIDALSCILCGETCSTCSDGATCSSCVANNAYLINGQCICNDGYFSLTALTTLTSCILCSRMCATCTSMNNCLTCVSNNTTIINGACVCNDRYFNTTELIAQDSCFSCLSNCSTCDSPNICLTCLDANASPELGMGCRCNIGYYIDELNNICTPCLSPCTTCSNGQICESCDDLNASPELNLGCKCNIGYYLDTSNICTSCLPTCASCIEGQICETCLDPNAIPESLIGCKCKIGYYLDTMNVCSPCLPSCIDCLDGITCLHCIDPNSQLNSSSKCECKQSYVPSLTVYCVICSTDCSSCDTSGNCLVCIDPNAYPIGILGCHCDYGYYFNSTLNTCLPCFDGCLNCTAINECVECSVKNTFGDFCEACDSSCASCDGPSKYDCLSCENSTLSDNVCLNSCPVGTSLISGKCVYKKVNDPIFSLNFKGSGTKFFDSINNFSAEAGPIPKGRRLQEDYGVISTINQGIYLEGKVPLIVSFTKTYLLGSQFAISIWFNPRVNSAILMKKYLLIQDALLNDTSTSSNSTSNTTIYETICIKYENLITSASIYMENKTLSVIHTDKLKFQKWNHVLLTVTFSSFTAIILSVNNKVVNCLDTANLPFIDAYNSYMYIAGDIENEGLFTGYLYSFEIYSTSTNFTTINSKVLKSGCSGCTLCPVSGSCIPDCLITQYYDQDSESCESCPAECSTSCKNSESCSLCYDRYCVGCSTFEPVSCYECDPYYQAVNWLCEPCKVGTYYDSDTKTCKTCVGLCTSCNSSTNCFTCAPNSELDSSSFCVCKLGYRLDDICIRNTFTAKSWIGGDNYLNLAFSEELNKELKSDDLDVFIDDSTVEFEIEVYDMSNFIIKPNLENIKKGSVLKAEILTVIVSKNNSLLVNTTFEGDLSVSEEAAALKLLLVKAAAAKDMAKKGATAGVSVALGISFMNFDPTSFFDFLNTAEMFYSVYLFNLTINPILSEFLMGLRIMGSIPNVFSYIIDENKGVKLSEKFKKFQYPSNLALLNIGVQIQSLFIFLILGLIVGLLSCITKLKDKLKSIRKFFVYGIFLRFWIQTYLEFLIACCVGIYYSKLENVIQKVDYCFCVILIIVEILGVLFFLNLLRKRRNLSTEAEITAFTNKFGTFFEEFKEISLFYWLFYFLYLARRTILVICFQFVSDGVLQLSTSIVFSIAIPLYVFFTRNFKLFIYNIYHFFNEILIGIYNTVILVSLIRGTVEESENLSKLCLQFITVAWAMNIGCSLFNTSKSIVEKIRKCIQNRKDRIAKVYKIDKYTNDTSIFDNKTHQIKIE